MHGWTGFLDEYTHMTGAETREPGLPETLSALLVSEACNVGLTPVADETYPPLSRARLNWVAHNYLRSAAHAAANARLVDYHTPLPLAQAWGGGEMASADGMRRHPCCHHPRRLQPALLRPPARIHPVLDGRHVHRLRLEADPRHTA